MDEHHVEGLHALVSQLRNTLGDSFQWEWDDRFLGALTQFNIAEKDSVIESLSKVFSTKWDVTNIKHAPEAVLVLSDFVGGLRPGQLLFVSALDTQVQLFCAYWPWANGTTISARLIPIYTPSSPAGIQELIQRFRKKLQI